jgi:hypothetical protein
MGQHDTSSLGGIVHNSRLRKELPIEGLKVFKQSGDYQGTEDADADAMTQFAACILRAEPNSAEQAELLDRFDCLRREIPPPGNAFVRGLQKSVKENIAAQLKRALGADRHAAGAVASAVQPRFSPITLSPALRRAWFRAR